MPVPMTMSTNTTLKRLRRRFSALGVAVCCTAMLVSIDARAGADPSAGARADGGADAAGAAPKAPPPRTLAAISYKVSFPAPQTHYLQVEATIPTDRKPEIELTI